MADTIVVANQTLLGEEIKNVFCFSNITNNGANLQIFADNFRTAWATHMAGGQTPNWSLDSLTFQIIDATKVLYSLDVSFTAGQLVGSQGGNPMPRHDALLVSLQYVGPAPNRGRTYLAGLTENSNDVAAWSPSIRQSAEDLLTDFVNGISDGAGDCFLRILRRPSSKFPAYVSSPISSVIAREQPSTMRSRRMV